MPRFSRKELVPKRESTRLAIESLERRDVPALISLAFAGEAVLEIDSSEVTLIVDGIPGSEIRSFNPGDEVVIQGSASDDKLTILNLLDTSPELNIQYLASNGVDTIALSGNRFELNLFASESDAGGAFVEAFRLNSPSDDPFPTIDPSLRITADSVEAVIGSNQSDIFNINGSVPIGINTGPIDEGALDTIVFANDARLIETDSTLGTIVNADPVILDFGAYLTSLTFIIINGQVIATNAGDDPLFIGEVAKIQSVVGGAGNDRFVLSTFGLPVDGTNRTATLLGAEGDDTFLIVDPAVEATTPIQFFLSGGTNSGTGTPTPTDRQDWIQFAVVGASARFDLTAYDRESVAPAYPGQLSSASLAPVRFVGFESFAGGPNPDEFVSSLSRLGSSGHFFEGGGGTDFFAVWNQAKDQLVVDSDDIVVSHDLNLDVISAPPDFFLGSFQARRNNNPNDLFFTQQKRSIAENDRLMTAENQYAVYYAFVSYLNQTTRAAEPAAFLQQWLNEVIEGRQLSSLDVVREFVLSDLDGNGTRDFYEKFFSGNFIPPVSVPDPTAAAQQAAQGLGLKPTAISLGQVLSDAQLVDSIIAKYFLQPFQGTTQLPEETATIRQNALTTLAAGGTWEDAIIQLLNSEEFLRTSVRLAAIDNPGYADFAPTLPEFSIVKASVPTLSVFRDGQWKVDADQVSLNARFEMMIQFGVAIDKPVLGDWNGDGLPDLGVFRDGVWYLDTNGIVGWQGDDTTINFGVQIDTPVVGDWNGDGIDDLGVYRNGTWFLDTNGTRGWQGNDSSASFGTATDKPVAADWNGDQRADLGVLRNGNQFFADTNGIRGWQGNDTSEVLTKSILQPVGGDFNFNGFGDISQFGAPGTELAAFDFAPVSAQGIQIQPRFTPGEVPVAWSRPGRPLSPAFSQYELLASQPIPTSSFQLSDLSLAPSLMSPTTTRKTTTELSATLIDAIFEDDE